jgi:hypothetical protein
MVVWAQQIAERKQELQAKIGFHKRQQEALLGDLMDLDNEGTRPSRTKIMRSSKRR